MAGKFEVKQGDSGKFSFNLKSGNGQVILTSQSYAAKSSALEGIESVRKKAQEKVFSQLGRWRPWNEKNPGLVIGVGLFAATGCAILWRSMKRNAVLCPLVGLLL